MYSRAAHQPRPYRWMALNGKGGARRIITGLPAGAVRTCRVFREDGDCSRGSRIDRDMDSAIGASPRDWAAWSERAVRGTHAHMLLVVLARHQRTCSETLPHSEHRRQRRKSGRQKKKPAEAGDKNSLELPERRPLKWKPLKPPPKRESLKPPPKREPLKPPLERKWPKRNPPKRCELNMFNIQFPSLVCMTHQIPSIPGIYRHEYVTSPLTRIDLRLGSRKDCTV
jgi:hypothetical protein